MSEDHSESRHVFLAMTDQLRQFVTDHRDVYPLVLNQFSVEYDYSPHAEAESIERFTDKTIIAIVGQTTEMESVRSGVQEHLVTTVLFRRAITNAKPRTPEFVRTLNQMLDLQSTMRRFFWRNDFGYDLSFRKMNTFDYSYPNIDEGFFLGFFDVEYDWRYHV